MDNKNKYSSPDIYVETFKVERKNVFMQLENILRITESVNQYTNRNGNLNYWLSLRYSFFDSRIHLDKHFKNGIPFVIECTLRFNS